MLSLPPALLITHVIVLMIAFPVHEFAHAWTANYFGDKTPSMNGRLTLNPIAHLDFIGSLMMLVAGFGWAKPVPVNPYVLQKRSPSALMWVALAGPLSNLLLAVVAAIIIRLTVGIGSLYGPGVFVKGVYVLPSLPQFLIMFLSINLGLMLFNLIPLAPLDGDKVAAFLFPPPLARIWDNIRPYGPMILLALLFLLPFFNINLVSSLIVPIQTFMYKLLTGLG